MKITLIVDRCQIAEPTALLPQVVQLLHEWGAEVRLIIPEACYWNLAHIQPTSDLYLLASHSSLALSLAGMLHTAGVSLINPYPVVNALHNKLIGLRLLQAHGLPIPETYVATNPEQLQERLAVGPLALKPQSRTLLPLETHSERLDASVSDLSTTATPQSPLVAQHYFDSFERHWLVYCIGGQMWSIEQGQPGHRRFRPGFGLTSADVAGLRGYHSTAARVDAVAAGPNDLSELALRCGRTFDIDLFAIKVVEHHGVLTVVDMVSFPDFEAVPEAALRLAEYLMARAQFLHESEGVALSLLP